MALKSSLPEHPSLGCQRRASATEEGAPDRCPSLGGPSPPRGLQGLFGCCWQSPPSLRGAAVPGVSARWDAAGGTWVGRVLAPPLWVMRCLFWGSMGCIPGEVLRCVGMQHLPSGGKGAELGGLGSGFLPSGAGKREAEAGRMGSVPFLSSSQCRLLRGLR